MKIFTFARKDSDYYIIDLQYNTHDLPVLPPLGSYREKCCFSKSMHRKINAQVNQVNITKVKTNKKECGIIIENLHSISSSAEAAADSDACWAFATHRRTFW